MKKIGIFLILAGLLVISNNLQDIEAHEPTEIEYLRTGNSKVYDLGDGVYQYQYFEDNIHYYTQEGFKEYNQTMQYRNSLNRYETFDNNYNVSIPQKFEVENLFRGTLIETTEELVEIKFYDMYEIRIEYATEMSSAEYNNNRVLIQNRSSNNSNVILEPRNHQFSERFITEVYQNDCITYYIYTEELSLLEVNGVYHFIDKSNASIFSIDGYYSRGANGQTFLGNETNVTELEFGVFEVEIKLDDSISSSNEDVYPVSTYGGVTYSLVSTPSGIQDKTIIEDTNAGYDINYFTVSKQTLMPAPAGSVPYLPVYNLYGIMELDFTDIIGSNVIVLDAKLTIQRESSNVNAKVLVSVITSSVSFDNITGNSNYTKSLLTQASIYTDLMVYDITQEVSNEINSGDNILLLEFSPELINLKTSPMKYMHFYSENANVEESPYFTIDVEGIDLTTNYGDAPSYTQVNGSSTNCFGYALRQNDTSYTILSQTGNQINFEVFDISLDYYYKVIVPGVLFTINNMNGHYARILVNVSSSVNVDEYRIALRVGNISNSSGTFLVSALDENNQDYYIYEKNDDFHFMLQLNNGSWAEKQSILDSDTVDGMINPSIGSWNQSSITGDYIANFYDSPTVYFAVKIKGADW